MSCKATASSTSTTKEEPKKSGSIMSLFCSPKKEVNNNAAPKDCAEDKCPPMPCFNTGDCKPAWLCSPPKPTCKTYPVPNGASVVPISKTGRSGSGAGGSGTCNSCGRSEERKKGPPEVKVKDCPMMKAKCPSKAPPPAAEKKESAGFFSKITSFFGGKK